MENEKREQNAGIPSDPAQEVPREELVERGLDTPADEAEVDRFGSEESDLGEPAVEVTEEVYADADDRFAAEDPVVDVHNLDEGMGQEPGYGPSPAERMASNARTQAGAAAEALRRGEFMRDVSLDADADSDDRLIGLLCYITQILIPLVMPVLVLLSESSKRRPFQRFHAVQSLAFVAVLTLAAILVAAGTTIVSLIPIIGWLIGLVVLCISPIAVLMAFFALVYYGYQAYQGKRFAIPGLTSFLQDQGWL